MLAESEGPQVVHTVLISERRAHQTQGSYESSAGRGVLPRALHALSTACCVRRGAPSPSVAQPTTRAGRGGILVRWDEASTVAQTRFVATLAGCAFAPPRFKNSIVVARRGVHRGRDHMRRPSEVAGLPTGSWMFLCAVGRADTFRRRSGVSESVSASRACAVARLASAGRRLARGGGWSAGSALASWIGAVGLGACSGSPLDHRGEVRAASVSEVAGRAYTCDRLRHALQPSAFQVVRACAYRSEFGIFYLVATGPDGMGCRQEGSSRAAPS